MSNSRKNKKYQDYSKSKHKTKNKKRKSSSHSSGPMSVKYNSWLKASMALKKGNVRPKMEDRILIEKFNAENHTFYIFMVLDGHGGYHVASFFQSNYIKVFKSFLKKQGVFDIRKTISDSFKYIDNLVKKYQSGTTVSMLMVIDDPRSMWLAHVGDSSAYGVKVKGQKSHSVQLLTKLHNIENKSEKVRIVKSEHHETTESGYVATKSGDMLAVTRAIGDSDFGPIIKSSPTVRKLNNSFDVIMIGTDGIWDVMNGSEVWNYVKPLYKNGDWRSSAYKLNKYRNEKYDQHDNTSIIFVYLDYNFTQTSSNQA